MNDGFETSDACDHTPIQIDVYGVKAQIRPVAAYEPPPRSWREVLTRLNRHLMTLVLAPVSVPAAIVEGTTNLVRGIGAMFTRRISDAHEEADSREAEREEQLTLRQSTVGSSASSLEAIGVVRESLEEVLGEFRAKGLQVQIRDFGGGRVGLFVLPEECIELAANQIENFVLAEFPSDDLERNSLRSWDDLKLDEREALANSPLSELDFPIRIRKLIVRLGLGTIADLVVKSPDELLKSNGFGEATLGIVQARLAARGLKLRGQL